MADKIKLVRADTRPRLLVTFTDANSPDPANPLPINITGGTPTFKFRKAGGLLLGALNGVVTDGPNGLAYFDWTPTILDVPAGDYEGESSVLFADGTRQTSFDIQKFTLREHF